MRNALPDEELVASVINKDIDDYREIVDRYEEELTMYVSFLVNNPIKTHELVQQTFINAYRNLRDFNPSAKFSNWMYRVAHLVTLHALKKGNKDQSESESFEEELSLLNGRGEVVSDPKLMKHVIRFGRKIPLKYRDVLALHFVCNKSINEISEILLLPTTTIEGRLARAEKLIKRYGSK
jgi:RNA polymerase sigma-70 factor (ECF subfamily)